MNKAIGAITTYHGDEHRYLKGYQIKVIAVFKGAARPDHEPDDGYPVITDNEDLARAGGLTADDRVEVQPWLESEGRFSFVSSDPRAIDLACFADLATND